jgi:hypothetical protein
MYLRVGPWKYDVRVTSQTLCNAHGEEVDGLAVDYERVLWISHQARGERRFEAFYHEAYHAFEFHFGQPQSEEDRANFYASVMAAVDECLTQIGGKGALDRLPVEVASDAVESAEEPVIDAVASVSSVQSFSIRGSPASAVSRAVKARPPVSLQLEDPSPLRGNRRRAKSMKDLATAPVRVIDEGPWRTWLSRAKLPSRSEGIRRHIPVNALVDGRPAKAPPSMPWENRSCAQCERLVAGGQIVNGRVFLSNVGPALQRTLYCNICNHLQQWLESAWPDGRPSGQCLQPEPHFVKGRAVEAFLEEHPEARLEEE